MRGSWPPANFPHLTYGRYKNHQITSRATRRYNCIAWAADDPERWWWPGGVDYWPHGVPDEETTPAFIRAFETLGYQLCVDATVESGFEKIALYSLPSGEPTHAARQLRTGKWTSKLGGCEDIRHDDPGAVNGPLYGSPQHFLKRSIRPLSFAFAWYRFVRFARIVLWEVDSRVRALIRP